MISTALANVGWVGMGTFNICWIQIKTWYKLHLKNQKNVFEKKEKID